MASKANKKQIMAEGFDRWTTNGVGIKLTSKPKKQTVTDNKKKSNKGK